MNGPGDFERELEQELHRILDPIAAAPIPLRRARLSGGIMKRLVGGAGAAIGLKVLTGFAVAAFAAGGAGGPPQVAGPRRLDPAGPGQHGTPTGPQRHENPRPSRPPRAWLLASATV